MRIVVIHAVIVFLGISLQTLTAQADGSGCQKDSLVHFFSKGAEVASEWIGHDTECNGFGGNRVFTPLHQIQVYVNYNIPGLLDLDELDQAFELAPSTGSLHDWFKRVEVAVVDDGWIKRVYNDDREAIVNFGGDTLFISAHVLAEGRMVKVLSEFYSTTH